MKINNTNHNPVYKYISLTNELDDQMAYFRNNYHLMNRGELERRLKEMNQLMDAYIKLNHAGVVLKV